MIQAEQILREGKVDEALARLKEEVRSDPSSARLRIFLFEVLSLRGDWQRAHDQLEMAGQLDAELLGAVQVYRPALGCEAMRAGVFAGERTPLVLGQPPEWVARLLEALRLVGSDRFEQAAALRDEAFDAAPESAGVINGQACGWLADGDSRLGPVIEAVVNGQYYWIPLERVARIESEPPSGLRDLVWLPTQFTWDNGGKAAGLIPTRYPGSEAHADNAVVLARRTVWAEHAGPTYIGSGQRMWATDAGEFSLLDVREVQFEGRDLGETSDPGSEASG